MDHAICFTRSLNQSAIRPGVYVAALLYGEGRLLRGLDNKVYAHGRAYGKQPKYRIILRY